MTSSVVTKDGPGRSGGFAESRSLSGVWLPGHHRQTVNRNFGNRLQAGDEHLDYGAKFESIDQYRNRVVQVPMTEKERYKKPLRKPLSCRFWQNVGLHAEKETAALDGIAVQNLRLYQ